MGVTIIPRSASLRRWILTLALRRWKAQSKLFALVLAVAVITGTVLAGSLLLVRSAEQAGVRDSLASMTADRVDVTVRAVNPVRPVTNARAEIDRATELAYGPGVDWTSSGWVTSEWVTTADAVYAYVAELDDPAGRAARILALLHPLGIGRQVPERNDLVDEPLQHLPHRLMRSEP